MSDTTAPPVPLPPRTSPFTAALQTVEGSDDAAAVLLAPRGGLTQVQIDCREDRVAALNLTLPGPGRALSVDGARFLNLGPTRWMAVSRQGDGFEARIRSAVDQAGAAVVDQSHGRAVLRLSGPGVRDVLAKGTGIDLHDRAFEADHVRQTGLFHVAVTVDRRLGPSTYDIHMPRGYAQALAERVIDAAREFGLRVDTTA